MAMNTSAYVFKILIHEKVKLIQILEELADSIKYRRKPDLLIVSVSGSKLNTGI